MTNDAKPTQKLPQPRFAPGPLGRGLYLADLVRWLMAKHEATRVHVVKEYLCPVLLAQCPQLYGVQNSGDASALSDERWWYRSGSGNREVISRGGRVTGSGQRVGNSTQYTPSIGQGLDGAVEWLRLCWGNGVNLDSVMDDKDLAGTYLAISEADARRCWEWVDPEAAPAVDVVAKPADAEGDVPEWLAAKGFNVAWMKGERDRFEVLHPKRGMGKLLEHLKQKGIEVPGKDKGREVRRVLDKHEKASSKANKATPFDALGSRKSAGKR